eukprot:scaffold19471_cov108-Isochrysis_galbana.AAC.2
MHLGAHPDAQVRIVFGIWIGTGRDSRCVAGPVRSTSIRGVVRQCRRHTHSRHQSQPRPLVAETTGVRWASWAAPPAWVMGDGKHRICA